MAYRVPAGAATLVEAEEVIQNWLRGVENARNSDESSGAESKLSRQYGNTPPPPNTKENNDFLSLLDWEQGSIVDNAKSVVEGLLRKDLGTANLGYNVPESHDPRIAMEMRHKKVRERRKLRDEKHQQRIESELLLKQAQKEAEEVVKREEKLARERAVQEEKLLNQQIMLIRNQMKEQQKARNQLAIQQKTALERELKKKKKNYMQGSKKESGWSVNLLGASPIVLQAEELIKSEKKRQQTRSELIKQLEEATAYETVENIKLIHRCFFAWYETVMKQRTKLAKAVVVREWKLVVRVWGAWKRFVAQRRMRREKDMVTREMIIMKREYEVASEHYEKQLLLRALGAWRLEVRLAKAQQQQLEQQELRRMKMEALLKVAAKKAEHQSEVQHISKSPSLPSRKVIQQPRQISNPPIEGKKPPVPKAPHTPEPAVWQIAKKQLAQLISDVDQISVQKNTSGGAQRESLSSYKDNIEKLEPTERHMSVEREEIGSNWTSLHRMASGLQNKEIKKPKPKPVTKPLPMKGMDKRSIAIAERRAAREQRKEALLKEKEEQMAREEQEKQQAELAAKEALIQQRKEKRRLAKQKEMERLETQRLQEELNNKASNHYKIALLQRRGLHPWWKFVQQCNANKKAADKLSVYLLQRTMFRKWKNCWCSVMAEKEVKAQTLRSKILLRRLWRAWIRSVKLSREQEDIAMRAYPHLVVKCAFHGWQRVTRKEQAEQWEKLARARRFRQRFLQQQVLRAWHGYIPIAKEERSKEARRAELRRKVSSWLTDFHPQPQPP